MDIHSIPSNTQILYNIEKTNNLLLYHILVDESPIISPFYIDIISNHISKKLSNHYPTSNAFSELTVGPAGAPDQVLLHHLQSHHRRHRDLHAILKVLQRGPVGHLPTRKSRNASDFSKEKSGVCNEK